MSWIFGGPRPPAQPPRREPQHPTGCGNPAVLITVVVGLGELLVQYAVDAVRIRRHR